ncbi:hypothetical protein CLOP_g18929 [Closterium sp. NIES-67]|nr:hypothetical protein CLOP_g18929 [Closterium sp. NIES-67]
MLEPGAQPTVQSQWRPSQPEMMELRKQLDYLLEEKNIRPSTSPYAVGQFSSPQRRTEDYGCVAIIKRSTTSPPSPVTRFHKTIFSKIDLHGAGTDRIWVPSYQLLHELLIQEVHDAKCSGHFGVDKTFKMLQHHYYWPNANHDVQQYVASCPTCQLMKSSRQKLVGLLQPLEPPTKPWTHVSMDFVTGLPAGASQNDAVLVVVDRLMKMAHFAPCRTTITAEQTGKLLISTVVPLHGIPKAIVSDHDPRFTSNFWTKMWEQYGMRLHLSTAYHPQTDGQSEQTNQTMEQLIQTTCTDPTQWEDSLPLIEFVYNNAPSSTTAQSSIYLNYALNPTTPTTPVVESPAPRSQHLV